MAEILTLAEKLGKNYNSNVNTVPSYKNFITENPKDDPRNKIDLLIKFLNNSTESHYRLYEISKLYDKLQSNSNKMSKNSDIEKLNIERNLVINNFLNKHNNKCNTITVADKIKDE